MTIDKELLALFQKQLGIIAQAGQVAEDLRDWAKSENWPGAHEWFRRFRETCDKHVNSLRKDLRDYYQVKQGMPAVMASELDPADYAEAWSEIQKCADVEQAGWLAIYAYAANEGDGAAVHIALHWADKGKNMVKKLNRFMADLNAAKAANDYDAYHTFDDKRK